MMNEQIKNALEDGVDLTEEEYRARMEAADDATEAHGIEGNASLSEKVRHDRIEMNFYGTCLNVLMCMYSVLEDIKAAVSAQAEMLASLTGTKEETESDGCNE